jgi:hypothetical protein
MSPLDSVVLPPLCLVDLSGDIIAISFPATMSSIRWVPHDGHPPKAEDLSTTKSRLYDTLQSSLQLVVKHYVGHRSTSCSVYIGVEGMCSRSYQKARRPLKEEQVSC